MQPKNLHRYFRTTEEYRNCSTGVYESRPGKAMRTWCLVHSGWPLRRGNHRDPSPHSYSYFTSEGRGRFQYYYYGGGPCDGNQRNGESGSLWTGHAPLLDATIAYNNAISRLYDKVRGGLDISVDAFQAKQTGKMFSASDQLTSIARDLSKSGFRKLSTIGSLWLQFQYGWLPTLGTIYGAADELLRYTLNRCTTYRASATSRNNGQTWAQSDALTSQLAAYEQLARVKVGVTFDNSRVINLARWSSLNPISIGWELLPFSFVVDWFIDIGGTLRSAESALLYSRAFTGGYVSTFQRTKSKQIFGIAKVHGGHYNIWGDATAEKVSFNRQILTSAPFPQRPVVNVNLGSGRLLNAAGLLSQFLK